VDSACGFCPAAAGPFYCPADRKVYIDLGFFRELHDRFGAPGDFAQAYVTAHEVGHHVQNLLGISGEVRRLQERSDHAEANALSVRLELQADCFASVWGYHADVERQLLEEGDIEEGLRAAAAIGDERIQSVGRASPPRVVDPRLLRTACGVVPPGPGNGRSGDVRHVVGRGVLTGRPGPSWGRKRSFRLSSSFRESPDTVRSGSCAGSTGRQIPARTA
jgi:hypothetical protein